MYKHSSWYVTLICDVEASKLVTTTYDVITASGLVEYIIWLEDASDPVIVSSFKETSEESKYSTVSIKFESTAISKSLLLVVLYLETHLISLYSHLEQL